MYDICSEIALVCMMDGSLEEVGRNDRFVAGYTICRRWAVRVALRPDE